jgi:hypothetical protein
MRVVVIGGRGNFGARICRALGRKRYVDVMPVGRAELDVTSPSFASSLCGLSPDVVIHCAGPFQDQDYRVAEAAIAARAHYLDLADGRAFVAQFASRLDAHAKAAGVLALSGASTLPALSVAVIDSLAREFDHLREVSIAIAPGQRAPRGAATLAGVFSYVGRPFTWLSGGTWCQVWGWQELRRLRFAGLGTRWAAACDVPDLALLPLRYPTLEVAEFRAALELGIQHVALWLAAGIRRAGIPLPLERWARPLDGLASLLNIFAGDLGGMLVSIAGERGGRRKRMDWHLTTPAEHGPEIPAMAAALVTRRIASGELQNSGAFPCVGFLALSDFEPEFRRWGISTTVEETA